MAPARASAGASAAGPSGSQAASGAVRVVRIANDEDKWWAKLKKTLGDAAFKALDWGPDVLEVTGIVFEFTGDLTKLAIDATDGTVPFVSIANALVTRVRDKMDELKQVDDLAARKASWRVDAWHSVIESIPKAGYPAEDDTYVKVVDALEELALLAIKWDSKALHKRLYWGVASRYREDLDKAIEKLDVQYSALLGKALIIVFGRIENIGNSTAASTSECIHNLPGGLPTLLGREAELEDLLKALATKGTVTSLTGIAGVGKSQLAYRCAYSFAFDGPPTTGGRFSWILDASNEDNLSKSYADALVELSGEKAETFEKDAAGHKLPPRVLADKLLTEIARSGRSSMLVFDNVKDDEDDGGVKWLRQRYFSSLARAASVHVLITSRSDAFRDEQDGLGHICQVPVNELSKDVSIALLLGEKNAGAADCKAAESIYERLGGHALALSVTRKYISSDEAKEMYGNRALQEEAERLEQGERPASADAAVAAAVARALEMVRQKHQRAWAILGVAAHIHPKDMPQTLLLRAAEGCTAADLRVLLRLNLLQWGASGQAQMRSMHRLLQGAVREKQGAHAALAAVWAEIALFEESNVSTWAYARSLMPHVEAMRESVLTGGVYDSIQLGFVNNAEGFICEQLLGDYDRALQAYDVTLRVEREVLGDDHPEVATTRNNIGSVYHAQGRHAEALQEFDEALRVRREALGDAHTDVAQTRNNIGMVYHDQGRHAEALQEYEKALRVRREALGDDHPSVATARNNIGMVYRAQGRHAEALQEYEEVLRVKREALGDDHPDVAETRNNIVSVYWAQGRHAEALQEFEEALRVKCEALGDDHPRVATARNNIGMVYDAQGRHAEALKEYEEVLRVKRAALGDDHPSVATTRNNIGSVYDAQGRHAEALKEYEEALRVWREALGDDHPRVATARNNIGSVYDAQGRHAEALHEFEEALRVRREALGDDHPDVAETRNNIVSVYWAQGRHAEALREVEEALRVFRFVFGDDHPSVATARNNVEYVRRAQGRHG